MTVSVPWMAEETPGQMLGARAASTAPAPGPPDLVHLNCAASHGDRGFYHHVHGIDYALGAAAVQSYALGAAGVELDQDGYCAGAGFVHGSTVSSLVVITVCSYNALARTEVRARFEITPEKLGRSRRVAVRARYSVASRARVRTCAGDEIEPEVWAELATCTLVRAFTAADDVGRPLAVCLPHQTRTKPALTSAIERAVAQLPRGHLLGARTGLGSASDCDRGDTTPTTRYRNRLIDSLVRLVRMDPLGRAAARAADAVRAQHGAAFVAVESRLLSAQHAAPSAQRFVALAHAAVAATPWLTQTAVVLVQQVRFLMARGAYAAAERVALRAVRMLPLDFDCWWHLALCYMAQGDAEAAVVTMNSLPVVFARGSPVAPKIPSSLGAPTRVPIPGEDNTQHSAKPLGKSPAWGSPLAAATPLTAASPLELSVLDPAVSKVCRATAPRPSLAALSAGTITTLDLDRSSTWGRAYDLLTLMAATLGWDNLVRAKAKVLRSAQLATSASASSSGSECPECARWLDQLFLVVYEDLRVLMTVGLAESNRSALSWLMIGILDWGCKRNWLNSISALSTSASAVGAGGGFDYFSSIKLLEIYLELFLSSVDESVLDPLSSVYDGRHYSTKLLLRRKPNEFSRGMAELEHGLFSLDRVLLLVMQCVSWNLRWYCYMPPYWATELLIKLCYKYDPVQIRTMVRVVFETARAPTPKTTSRLLRMFLLPDETSSHHAFSAKDTIVEYMYFMLDWIDLLQAE